VLVTPPDRSPLSAAIVDGGALGRFFFLEFAWPVEHVGIAVEPSRLAQPFPFLVNTRAEDRRMEEEAIVAGQGESPVGTRWRLRVWQAAPGDRRLSFEEQRRDGHWDGGGCGGPGRGSDQLVRLSMAGGNPRREQHLVGEVDSSIAAVRLVLEEGHEIAAQVLRGEDLPDDYWVAFVGPEARVTDLVALDEHGEIVARDAHAIEALQRHREFSEREWRPS
jgi:hypothetical protein